MHPDTDDIRQKPAVESGPGPAKGPSVLDRVRRGEHAVVLFDGVCNLCNAAVDFVLDRDPKGYFVFGALQGETARSLQRPSRPFESIFLLEDGAWFDQSTAALRILRRLAWPWPVLYLLVIVPRPIRDAVYAWIARNRYGWFGKRDTCRMPTPEIKGRFLDEPVALPPQASASSELTFVEHDRTPHQQ